MANRNWGRNGPGYGMGGGYMGPNSPAMNTGMGFYVNPMDRRPQQYHNSPMGKPYGSGYRDDSYRRPRDDYRGGKRQRTRSPPGGNDRRSHHDSYSRRDNRSGKRPQFGGRYDVKVPKMPFNVKSITVPEAKMMYHGLTLPGDFSKACLTWQDAFPLHEPMSVATKTDVYIVHRDVESNFVHPADALEAPDADYSYSVRVMAVASPELAEFYKQACRMLDEKSDSEKVMPTKNIHFIVGGRSKGETMGIGGAWSPSLDGEDPDTNPQTLINTAIRTFKGFTGIDLSSVTEWIRFMELRYYRGANNKAPTLSEENEEREIVEDKQEVVVFFIPNMSHLVPTDDEWEKTKQLYTDTLQKVLEPSQPSSEPVKTEEKPEETPSEQMETSQAAETTLDESHEAANETTPDGGATHFSKLDVNNMKVTELRAELTARNLDNKGVKANLICRLQNALDDEKKAELGESKTEDTKTDGDTAKPAEETPSNSAETTATQPKDDQPKEISEKDRRRLERLYRLGDKPAILVYPNRSARGGRFDCHRVSLHSLLNYQTEEQKELNFEVCLFAEQFHSMMQRDCAFTIFKGIYSAPEKDAKDVKSDQNGHEEPESKRRRESESESVEEDGDNEKLRKCRRTVDPALLFAFSFYDAGHSNFIRESDVVELIHLLDLGYSKSQVKKLVAKVTTNRDAVRYRHLTDQDVVPGSDNDVVRLKLEAADPEFLRDLAAGNDLLFGGAQPAITARTVIASAGGDDKLLQRMQAAEEMKKSIEFQFFQIKDELERTRSKLSSSKNFEEKLRKENREYQDRLRDEQRASRDNKQLVSTYNHLLRRSRELMANAVSDIDKQFEKEKAKREAEKAEAEAAEKAKREAAGELSGKSDSADPEAKGSGKADAGDATAADSSGAEKDGAASGAEKEWEVVDQV